MPNTPSVKPTQKAVKEYYAALKRYADQDVDHESAVRSAFQNLLDQTGRRFGWTLIPELSEQADGHRVQPDGTFRDDFHIRRGHWEAKDTHDDLEAEIGKKIRRGYPLSNIIFEDTRTAHLYQNGRQAMKVELTQPGQLCDLLNAFFGHTEPAHEDFGRAIDEFQQRVPELAEGLVRKIDEAHRDNRPFQEAFERFFELCRESLNPNLSREAVDEMLVQHLLTERLIRTIFDRQDFVRRNVIAAEVEKVIDTLTAKAFSRHAFLKSLDPFYLAIEAAAATIGDFAEKQHFLNTIYERFFQGYSVKVADTMGIVYTPQEIVDFMCASVEEVLKNEFGKDLGSPGVNILDPCTGTGNFIVNLIRRIPKRNLRRVYREQLFANEVMLMPYYIAALNIEHAYYERTGEYEPFEGLCFVDTLDLAKDRDSSGATQTIMGFKTEENTARVERQQDAEITVIVGNPPYNANQVNENDNNKNRKYRIVDTRVKQTYVKATSATKTKCYDPYVKFFRWASDRLGSRDGIVCFITNNSFVHQRACEGLRKILPQDFSLVFHLDLRGNVQQNPELSGTAYNVFGIKVGVGITIAVRHSSRRTSTILYEAIPLHLRREQKLARLSDAVSASAIDWTTIRPAEDGSWFQPATVEEFRCLPPLGSKEGKRAGSTTKVPALFKLFSLGVSTNRDDVVYGFRRDELVRSAEELCDNYNGELDRYIRKGGKQNLDEFLNHSKLKWSRNLKRSLRNGRTLTFDRNVIRLAAYRPFTKKNLFLQELAVDELGQCLRFFPSEKHCAENRTICLTADASEKPFMCMLVNRVVDLHMVGAGCGTESFPFYVYNEDGSNRRENVTDWALAHFREHYGNKKITKWDIFYYVYGVLHHPGYRERFAENLKRELPRVPMAPDFRAFADGGRELARLHLEYEDLEPHALDWIETPDVPLSYRVEKMRLSKDKTQLKVNDSLSLAGIPPKVFEYRLGNRSALDWVIDQYRVKTDKRSGIASDPNRADDPEYIVRLVGQVVRVSLETVRIVGGLPEDFGRDRVSG